MISLFWEMLLIEKHMLCWQLNPYHSMNYLGNANVSGTQLRVRVKAKIGALTAPDEIA